MALKALGIPIETADMVGTPGLTQKARIIADDFQLTAARAVVIHYNDPAYTDLTLEIWSNNDSGNPGVLFSTSTTTWLKSEISTLDNALKEIYFAFNKPMLQQNEFYHFALRASGYTGDASAHLAWALSWPRPRYTFGVTETQAKAAKYPLDLHFIGHLETYELV